MQTHDIVVESALRRSFRVDALESIYDCPLQDRQRLEWHCELPSDDEEWNVGLIVGPSGSGKSTLARKAYQITDTSFPDGVPIIDAIGVNKTMQEVASVLSSVGLNTIPTWAREYKVLSTGEKFRSEIANALITDERVVCIDEFTSVVDRSVAKIVSNSVQKYVRKHNRKFVAVTCHYDVEDWLQPDWIFDMTTNQLTRRSLRRRPTISAEVRQYKASEVWPIFSKYHYMTNKLHGSAQCYCVVVDNQPIAIAAMLYQPHSGKGTDIWSCSRLVTLPDYQGLGIAMQLIDWVGEHYANQNKRVHTHPAHPSLIASFAKSPRWRHTKKAGTYSRRVSTAKKATQGGRPCATFVYVPT